MNKSVLSVPFELKELSDSGEFTGIASPYGVRDLGNDVVDTGAFTKTIAERGSKVRLLDGHEVRIGIASTVDTGNGLEAKGKINLDKQAGRDAYSDLKFYRDQGLPMGLSIGYETIKADQGADGARHLKEVRLWEISITEFPMNEAALVHSVKSADKPKIKRENNIVKKELQGAVSRLTGNSAALVLRLKDLRHKMASIASGRETKSGDMMDACMALCRICSDVCSSSIYYSWGSDVLDQQEHLSLLADCGACCDFCCGAMCRDSASMAEICALCALCCRKCAAACSSFGDDPVMVACAAVCNACADCCAAMPAAGMETMSHAVGESKAGRRLSAATMDTMKSAHEHVKSASDILLALLEVEDGELADSESKAAALKTEPVDHSAAQQILDSMRSLIPAA